jgi:LPXTG-motif cell wall-anchored protein
VYSVSSTGQLYSIVNGSVTAVGARASEVTDFNGLGIGSGGGPIYAYQRSGDNADKAKIFKYDSSTGTWSSQMTNAFSTGLHNFLVAGAVDLNTNAYLFGGFTKNGTQFKLWKYTGSGTPTYLGYLDTSANAGGASNGDMAFDAAGNLFVVRGSAFNTTVFSVTAANLANANGGKITSSGSSTFNTTNNVNGVAFDASGKAYLGSGSTLQSFTMPSWTGSATVTTGLNDSTDLASCSSPATITLEKDVKGRVNSSDQFALSLDQGTTNLGKNTTTGTATGVQDQRVGPLPTARNTTVSFSEVAAPGTGTDLTQYATTWACKVDGTLTKSGTGTTGTMPIPSSGQAVLCQFVNSPLLAKVTIHKQLQEASGADAGVGSNWPVSATLANTSGTVTMLNAGTVNTNSSGDSSWTAKFGTTSASTDIKVSEQQKDGYAFASGKCTVTHLDGTTASTNLTSANAQTVAGVKAGDQVDCTYTNKLSKAKLTLVKKVNNQYGGTATASDFTLTAAGKDTVTGKGDSDAVKDQSVTPGEYTLSESGGGAGYVQDGAWICDNATVSNSEVNLTAGSDVTCTVTNKDVPAKLTLKKVVKGGTAAPGDFTLTAKGSKDTVAGAGNSSAVTGKNVSIGAYTLSESGGPTGYEQDGAWDCGSATMSDTTVTLKPGDDVTCTVTNVAKQGAVTWKKEDGSGNALTGSEWTLTPPSGSDVTVADCVADSAAACDGPDKDPKGGQFSMTGLAWGQYVLVESKAPAGYVLDSTTKHKFTVDGKNLSLDLGSIKNEQAKAVTLPLTGGTGTDIFVISGGVLLVGGAAAATIYGIRRRHRMHG